MWKLCKYNCRLIIEMILRSTRCNKKIYGGADIEDPTCKATPSSLIHNLVFIEAYLSSVFRKLLLSCTNVGTMWVILAIYQFNAQILVF